MGSCEHCGAEHAPDNLFCANTGKLMAERLLPPHSMLEGKYLVDKPLGVGGMGAVFEATHTLLEKKVAIKVMLTDDQHAMTRLAREARAASATGHPNITAVTDMGTTAQGSLFVVMEYLEGQTLRKLCETPVSPRRAAELIIQVLAGLEAVHRRDIVHRDLKPDNLMLVHDDDGNELVKILDFGISKRVGGDVRASGELTVTGQVIGTPLYMAPEQAAGDQQVGAAADIYAVGAILYYMVTGRPPHDAESLAALIAQKLEKMPAPPSRIASDVPTAFDELVLRALSVKPEQRFKSARDMREQLSHWLKTGKVRDLPDGYARLDGDALADSLVALDEVDSEPRLALSPLPTGPARPDERTRGRTGPGTPSPAPHSRSGTAQGGLQPIPTGPQRPDAFARAAQPRRHPAFDDDAPLELDDRPLHTMTGTPQRIAPAATLGLPPRGAARVRKRGGGLKLLLGTVVLAAIGFAVYHFSQGGLSIVTGKGAPKEVKIQVLTTPPGAEVLVDGTRIVGGSLTLAPSSTESYELLVRAPGYIQQRSTFVPETNLVLRIDLAPITREVAKKHKVAVPKKRPQRKKTHRRRR